MDLDAMLNDAANEVLTTAPVTTPKPPPAPVPEAIKPWLAASANVPKEFREKWTAMVKNDRNAVIHSQLQPSNAYRSWDSTPLNPTKILTELVRKAAATCNFDESKTVKLQATFNPDLKHLQSAYAAQIIKDLKETVLKDPNYDPAKYPNLAAAISK